MNDDMERTPEEKRTRLKLWLLLIAVTLVLAGLLGWYSFGLSSPDTAINTDYYNQLGADKAPSVPQRVMMALSDGFFIIGVLLGGVGCLTWISSTGFFDMLTYGFHSLKSMIMPFRAPKKPKPFYDYKLEREERRKKPLNMPLILGVVYIALALVFTMLFYAI